MTNVTYSQRIERAVSQPWLSNERTELPMTAADRFGNGGSGQVS